MRAVDCQGFAGGFTTGVVRAGFKLVHKAEMAAGFGVVNCTSNRHVLGYDWQVQTCDPSEWEPVEAEFVFGNPPCSGFSLLSNRSFRGVDSPINHCMHALVGYAGAIDPQVIAFESVAQAYKEGLPLMRQLHQKLMAQTGHDDWQLYHVLHNNLSVGGCAVRRRYFWVASRVPLEFSYPELSYLPTVRDAIQDLEHLALTWELQPYGSPDFGTRWSRQLRAPGGYTDGHHPLPDDTGDRRLWALREHSEPWEEGETLRDWARRTYDRLGTLPEPWTQQQLQRHVEKEWDGFGFHQPKRWRYDRQAHVITGGSPGSVVHPTQYRHLTMREVARIMGFPDTWRIAPYRDSRTMKESWGKGIPVHSGLWLARCVRAALEGRQPEGELAPHQLTLDQEHIVDVTKPHLREVA
jgi:site-specific DNA-cytosine methylase